MTSLSDSTAHEHAIGAWLPVTAAQSEVWVAQRIDPDSPAQNIAMTVEVAGPLDIARAVESVYRTIRRAEALHVRFDVDDDRALRQQRRDPRAWTLHVVDLRAELDPVAAAEEWIARDLTTVARLGGDEPLFTQAILRIDDDLTWWHQRYHHSIVDGYAMILLVEEVVARQERPNLDTEERDWSLRAAIDADLAYRASPRFTADRNHWLQVLADAPEPPALLPPAPNPTAPAIQVTVELDPDDAATLYRFADVAGIRRTRVPFAIIAAYLHRVSGVTELMLSVPLTGRTGRVMRQLPSMASTILPMRLRVDGAGTLGDLAARIDRELIALLRHGRFRGEDLARELRTADPSRRVFGPGVNILMFEHPMTFGGSPARARDLVTGAINALDFTVRGGRDDEPLRIDIRVGAGLDDDLERHRTQFTHFLREVVARPGAPVSAFDVMSAAQRERILVDWNDTARPQAGRTVPDMIAAQVAATPAAEALVAGDTRLTYRELGARVNQLAHHLLDRGLRPEQIVAVGLPRSAEMVIGLLATLSAGGAFVPLDPSWPADRRGHVLADADARLVLTGCGGVDAEPETAVSVDLGHWSYGHLPTTPVRVPVHGASLAYVIFTSGSTGRPKGAMIRHEAICARLSWQVEEILGFGADDAALFKAPLAFDISVNEILLPLVSGGRLVVAEQGGERDPQYLLDLIDRERVTFVYLVSSMLAVLLDLADGGSALAGLRHVWCGGEVLTPHLFDRFRRQLGTTLYHGYGPAEATIGVSHVVYRESAERIATSIGRPNPNTQLYVLDPQLRPVPPGIAGELYAGGYLLGRGYVSAPGMTAARFVANPFGDSGSRLYRTGDLTRWTESGSLDFVGRADNQVKLRGMRLELEDVESALSRHPGVRQVAAVVRGSGAADYLAAYVVPDPANAELDGAAVREWAASRLPEYMVPTAVVVLGAFPLTANGKLDRRALPEPDLRAGSAGVAPRSTLEATLADIVAAVLGLDSVGVTDDFFSLGGDSIVAIQVVGRARAAGLDVDVRELFTLRTVEALAREVAGRAVPDTDVADIAAGMVPATPIVERTRRAGSAVSRFHQSVLVRTPAGLTADTLHEAVQTVLDRHPALRAHLVRGDRWRLNVPETGSPATGLIRIVDVPAEGTRDTVIVRETAAAAARLDPDAGIMLQAVWFDGGDGPDRPAGGRLLLVIHHLVVDGVSWRILVEDLARAATAPHTLVPTTGATSLRRWAHLFTDRAAAGAFDGELDHWRAVTATADGLLGDRPLDPALDTWSSAFTATVELDSASTAPLLSAVPAAFGGGVNDVLLTALAVAIARWRGTGDTAVLVDLEGHGREEDAAGRRVDLGRTVGWFTSVYPVRLDAGTVDAGDPTALAAGVKAIKEQLRAVPGSGIGYGALRYLTETDLAPASEPQVLFNYLGRATVGDDLTSGPAGGDWMPVAMGGAADPDAPMGHVVTVDAVTHDGSDGPTLHTTVTVPSGVVAVDRVQALAAEWARVLGAIAVVAELGGPTPSDYPAARLTQLDVDQLRAAVPGLTDILALTPLQEGIYFHSAFEDEGTDPYLVQQVVALTGTVDPAAFAVALQSLVDRHAALRTGLHALADGRVVQAVSSGVPVPMGVVDLSGLDSAAVDDRVRLLLDEDRARGFDLDRPPLVRFTLVRTGERAHLLLQSIHHVIADGWSVPVMLRELLSLYVPGGATPVLPAPAGYRTYLDWLASQDREASVELWRAALAGVDEPTGLAAAAPRRADGVASVPVRLSAERTAELGAVGRAHGLTTSTLVHGAWGLLLGRLTGRDDVLFGSTVSGRGADLPGIETMVGLFINTVPARLRFRPDEAAVAALARWQDEQSALLDHQYLGLGELRRLTGLRELFDTLVVFENYPIGRGAVTDTTGQLAVTGITFEENPPYPVTLLVAPGDELRLEVKYRTALVDAATASSLAHGMVALLEQIVGDPTREIAALDLVSAGQRAELEAGWAASRSDTGDVTLPEMLDAQAAATPDAIAVEFEDTTLTYAQVHAHANRLAHILVERGVGPESVVAVALGRSPELVVALLAVGKAGGAYLPLDLDYPPERLALMLTDADPVCVLTGIDGIDTAVPQIVVDMSARQGNSTTSVRNVSADHPVYVIYTSGSTGRPKGVLVPHRGVVNRLRWMQSEQPLAVGDRVLQKTPSSFDVSVPEFFGPLIAGATLVLARPGGHRDPAYLAALIAEKGVTRAHFVPSMLDLFLAEPNATRCVSLRQVSCSGEALSARSARRFAEVLPGARLDNLYGPTEAAVEVTYRFDAHLVAAGANAVPIGSPVANTRLYVLDRCLSLVPPGSEGELYLAGPQLARGYLGRAALTADRFVADPFDAGERMYRTGDLVRSVDGELEYVGRADGQVKLHGFRIELGEIEAVLLRDPTVAQAAVVVREDRPGHRRLVAYVVAAPGVRPSDGRDHRQGARAVLPPHMVPSAYIELDALPLTPSGKLDRAALPAPDFAAAVSDRVASTATEERVAAMFADVLGLDRVGAGDDFFALGGDSILAIRLVNVVRKSGHTLTPRQVFELRTPAAIARLLGDARTDVAAAPATVVDDGVGEVIALPVVHRLSEWSGSTDRFNQAVLVHLPAGTDTATLTAALQAVLDHHDGLRTVLTRHAPGVWSTRTTDRSAVDAAGLVTATPVDPDTLRAAVAEQSEAATARLDPEAGIMVQAVHFDAGPDQVGRLLIVAHHLAVDGVSWRIILEDLAMSVVAVAAGEPPALDPVGTSIRRFGALVTDRAQTAARLTELDHWLRVTAPGAALVPGASGPATVGTGARHRVSLSSSETAAVLTAVPALAHAEVTDVLVTALRIAVTRWHRDTGRDASDLLVDLERHGRAELEPGIDLSRTVGWFTDIGPVRLPAGDDPLAELQEVKETLREMPGLGYGMLRYSNARTAGLLAAGEQSQVLFNYLGRTGGPTGGVAWTPAPESDCLATEPDHDMSGPYRLVVNVVCTEGVDGPVLSAVFGRSDPDLSEADGVALADGWVEALRDLIAVADTHVGGAVLTPSDVPLVALTQSDLDAVAARHPAGIETVWPLSPLQEGLYFQAAFGASDPADGASDIYTAQFTLDVTHRLDLGRLAAALRTLQRRNPTLRAGFVSAGLGQPVQFVTADLDVPVVEHDLRGLDAGIRESRAAELMAADRDTPFDLAAPPLWRVMVIRLADDHDRLVVNRQFLLWDGWSNGIVVGQLLALYDTAGDDSALPAPAGGFADYLAWLAEQDAEESRARWRDALAGLAEPTLIGARVSGSVGLPGRHDTVLSPELARALRDRAATAGVTLNTVLSAALALVLGGATGRRDVVFGTTVAGRPPEVDGVDTVAGLFLNTVPVRTVLRPDESVAELLQRSQSERLDLTAHDYLGLATIGRETEHRQLFDVLYVLQNFVDERQVSVLNATHDISGGDSIDHTHYPLTVVVTPGTEIRIKFEYRSEAVDSESAATLLARFVRLLDAIAAGVDAPVGSLDLLMPGERAALTARPADRELPEATIADLFADAAARIPDQVALVFGAERVTYRDLDGRINSLARRLLAAGAGPERIVALGLPRSVATVVALFAVLRTGAAYLPLELDHPAERLVSMLDDARPVTLVTTAAVRGSLSGWAGGALLLDSEPTAESTAPLTAAELGAFAPGTPGRLDHPAYVIYTSGSTGKPKGVVTGYRGLTNMQFNHREAIFAPTVRRTGGRTLRIAHTVSFAFDMSWEELLWLVEGHEVHICDENLRRDADSLVRYCDEHTIDVVNVTPTYAQHLFEAGLLGDGPGAHRPPLVLLGGEAVPDSVWNRLRETDGTVGYNLYGPTEYTINTLGAGTDDSATPTVGTPIWNTRGHLLDDWLRPVPAGVPGELYISGVGLARGYLDRFALTAERFVADPFESGARMYRTGDLMRRRPDGNLDYLGRTDDQVKIRGHRVELGEIESVLAGLDGVGQCAVIAAPGPGGDTRLVAYVVAAAPLGRLSGGQDHRQYAQALRACLPDHLVPSLFVDTDSLPMTVNGKLDVRALPPVPATTGSGTRPPADHVEAVLCAAFGEVLGVVDVGAEDDFFDLGGHSLLATRVISRARAALATELTLRDLFEAPTVAELAQRVRDRGDAPRPALVAGPRPDRIPLSAAQQRLWLIQQMDPASAAYNFPIVLRLRGDLDADALTAALGDVVTRHEVLRTVFDAADGVPVQRVLDEVTPEVEVVDAGSDEAVDLVRAAVLRPFDLSREIPLRATVIRLGVDADGRAETVLALVLHHVATDEWSDRPFLRDLMLAYATRRAGTVPEWEPLPVQYADYTLWQNSVLGDAAEPASVAGRQLDFWQRQLAGAPEELVLPADRARPARPGFNGGAIELDLDADTTAALRSLAAASGASMFMVLHAATAALLTRIGAGEDLPLGAPVAGRTEPGLDDLVGFFVNTVVLRTDTSGDPTFGALLARVREVDLAAFANADVPFESVVERVNPARTLARNPLFQVMVGYHSRTPDITDLGEITLEPVAVAERTAKFDLVFNYTEFLPVDGGAGRVQLRLEYGADLFDRATADAIARRQVALIGAVAADPQRRIGSVDVFLPGERDLVLVEFNDTARAVADETLDAAFVRQVAATPDAIAVVDARTRASFAELDERSDRISAVLAEHGVGAESVVGLAVPRSVDMVAAILAVLKRGAAYLPLDLSHPADRITYMLEDSNAAVLLSTVGDAGRIDAPGLPRILLDDPQVVAELAVATPPVRRVPDGVDHAAYVIYTSGSTGRPKGVVVPHEGISSLVATAEDRMALTPGSVVMQFASVGFDVAVFELSMALCTGSRLVIVPEDARVAGPELTDFMHAHKVTHAIIPPSLMAALPPGALVPEGCTVLVGTETVPPDLIGRWAQRLNLLAAYGLTEATVNNTLWQAQPGWTQSVPIGIPDPNEQAYVLDSALRPLPVGVAGELYIAGRGLARGYLGRPALTAGRFVANPFGAGRMYRTGDLARWRGDGNIDFLGRVDDQVKIRGFRIELGEIVAALAAAPNVNQATVVVDRDGSIARLIGYVVPTAGESVDPARVRAHVAASLPDYMVPSVVLVLDSALPLTPNGKLDRAALPAPDWSELTGDVAPRTEREAVIAAAFAEILRLPSVGVHDNFFDLGGHSMASMQLVGRVRARLGAQLSIREVFDAPTVAELAVLTELGGHGRPALVSVADTGAAVRLSTAQRRQWRQRSGLASHALSLYPTVPLDAVALAAALSDVTGRHEPLRTGYLEQAGAVSAVPAAALDLERVDTAGGDLRTRVFDLAQRPMDLAAAAPLRVSLVDGDDGEQALLLAMHYLAVDEWSVVPLLGELLAACSARAQGRVPELPELSVGYRDYVAWQGEVLGDRGDPESRYVRQLDYWRDRLADLPQQRVLPGSAPGGQPGGGVAVLPIDAELHAGIDALARRTSTSMFMVLQSALAAVLTEAGAGVDLPIGALVAGRPEEALAPLIGCFFDTVVLRTDTSGTRTFAELLSRVRASTLAALDHQDIGFDAVATELDLDERFPSVTVVHHEQARLGDVGSTFGELVPVPVGVPAADLTLSFYEPVGEGPVHAYLGYRTDALDAGEAATLAERIREVLVEVCADESRPIRTGVREGRVR